MRSTCAAMTRYDLGPRLSKRAKSSKIAGIELGAAISTRRSAASGANAVDRAGDRIGGDRPAEGMADDRRERAEPLAGHAHGIERMQHGEAPARRRRRAPAGRARRHGSRRRDSSRSAPSCTRCASAQPWITSTVPSLSPAGAGRNSNAVTLPVRVVRQCLRASASRPAARSTALRSRSPSLLGLGVLQNSSKAIAARQARRDVLARAEQRPDDLMRKRCHIGNPSNWFKHEHYRSNMNKKQDLPWDNPRFRNWVAVARACHSVERALAVGAAAARSEAGAARRADEPLPASRHVAARPGAQAAGRPLQHHHAVAAARKARRWCGATTTTRTSACCGCS